jgi:hypothetical protein
VARAAARVAAGQAGLEEVVLDWERALAEREALNRQRTELASNPPADPATRAALEETLAERRRELDGRIAAAEDRLRSEFPRFFDLVSPAPVSVAELQGTATGEDGAALPPLLAADEALVLLAPPEGDYPGLVWAVSREGVAWAEIPLGEEELAAKLARLHAMLDMGGAVRAPDAGGTQNGTMTAPVRGYDRALALELYTALFGAPEIAAVLADKPDWVLAPHW